MDNSNNSPSVSSSGGGVGSPSNGGSGSEALEETQDEEPSSSNNSPRKLELDNFRQQWKRELEASPNKDVDGKKNNACAASLPNKEVDSTEEKAKQFFLKGVKAEKFGKLQEAISWYRKAIQLVPDIEFRIEENMDEYSDEFSEESSEESDEDQNFSGSDEDNDDLMSKFLKIASKIGTYRICEPKFDQNDQHISSLPSEVFLYILKWVVSQDLDVISLEKIAKVCRGFYLCARDSEIWHSICIRTWDINLDTPNKFGSWRNMFLQRPHLFFNGVYISKTTYVRYGESAFQDANYRPCYLVEYFRYLRFFPDGVILMLTTPDDPYQSLYKLRYKHTKDPNVMIGRYKLVGSTVMAVVKKQTNDVAPIPINYYRYRRQRQQNLEETQDQTFHLELELKNVKKRINCQLTWNRYSIHMVYRNGHEAVTNFDIVPSKFPVFWFSRVKSYTAESESPLK